MRHLLPRVRSPPPQLTPRLALIPTEMLSNSGNALPALVLLVAALAIACRPAPAHGRRTPGHPNASAAHLDESLVYLWPLPTNFSHGNQTLSVDPNLALEVRGPGGSSPIVLDSFERYRDIIFKQPGAYLSVMLRSGSVYDISKLTVFVASDDDSLQLGVDESYALYVGGEGGEGRQSVVGQATIEVI